MDGWPGRIALAVLPAADRAVAWLLGWLATYAIHSTILITFALALAAWARRRRRSPGSGFWGAALLGGIVTATVQSAGLLPPLAGTVRLTPPASAQHRAVVTVREVRTTPWNGADPDALPVRTFVARAPGAGWPLVAVLAWLGGAGASLAYLLLARARFAARLAGRRDAEYTVAGLALREVRRRAGVCRPVRVSVSPRLASPVALGRDEVCIPSRALAELDPLQIESMLAHELAHLVRRDQLRLVWARVVEAVFFFQPLNRLARRRMQEAAEMESDAWAVRVVSRPLTLARCLARVADWTTAGRVLPAPAMTHGHGSALVERVRRLTGRQTAPPPDGRSPAPLLAAALLALAAVAPRAAIGVPVRAAVRQDVFVLMTADSLHPPPRDGRIPGGMIFVRIRADR